MPKHGGFHEYVKNTDEPAVIVDVSNITNLDLSTKMSRFRLPESVGLDEGTEFRSIDYAWVNATIMDHG
jgi:hypothetical protein